VPQTGSLSLSHLCLQEPSGEEQREAEAETETPVAEDIKKAFLK